MAGTTSASSFGRFEILAPLGRGAVGEIYKARAVVGRLAGKVVCLKVLGQQYLPDGHRSHLRGRAIRSLHREAEVASELNHRNIPSLLEARDHNGTWYLVFELVDGADLHSVISTEGLLKPALAWGVAVDGAAVLAHAHGRNVWHRDIKPGNIIVSIRGDVHFIDFGQGKVNANAADRYTAGLGTPRYASPEHILRHDPGPETDVYAFGVVLFETLTGLHPFDDDDPGTHQRNVLDGRIQHDLRGRGIPEELVAIVLRCIERDRTKRYQDGACLKAAVSQAVSGHAIDRDSLGEVAATALDRKAMMLSGNQDDTTSPSDTACIRAEAAAREYYSTEYADLVSSLGFGDTLPSQAGLRDALVTALSDNRASGPPVAKAQQHEHGDNVVFVDFRAGRASPA